MERSYGAGASWEWSGMTGPNILKTHCPKGHAYTRKNTYLDKRRARTCRTCHRESVRLSKVRQALSMEPRRSTR